MKIPKATKLPSGTWRIYMRLGGRGISITAPTKAECEAKAKEVKRKHVAGLDVTGGTVTIGDLANQYIEERRAVLSPSTIVGYKSIVTRYENLCERLPDRVNWQAEVSLAARKLKPKTVKNDFRFFASVLKSAGLQMPQIRLPQIIHEEHPWLTPEQIPVFLKAIHGGSMEIGCLLALHGLRLSELLALEMGSIWGGVIYVRGAVVKGEDGLVEKKTNKNTSSRREVPVLIPRLQELVDAAPNGKLHRYTGGGLYDFINRVCKRNGLPECGVHGLRHSAVSLAYRCGLSPLQSQKIFGYSDLATMQKVYTHLSLADRDAGADKLKAFFKEA